MKNLSIVSMFATIGLISCFDPITEEVVFAVEDSRNPVIVISSPTEGSVYMSEVIVQGHVRDDSLKSGDNKGSLRSLSISASSSQSHRGRIEIESDGSYDADTSFGQLSGSNFTYNPANRGFSITIDTADYRSQIMYLIITAVDMNGNESKKSLELVRSAGPYIELTSPSGNTYSLRDEIVISGKVANSDSQRDRNDEIKNLTLQIPILDIDVALDIGGGDTRVNLESRKTGTSLSYNEDSSAFTCSFTLWSSEISESPTLSITVAAEDKNGNPARVNRTIRPATSNPTIYSDLSTERFYYYTTTDSQGLPFYSPPTSTASGLRYRQLSFSGKVRFSEVVTEPVLTMTFLNTATKKLSTPVEIETTPTSEGKVLSFSYSVSVGGHSFVKDAGRVSVTLLAKNSPTSSLEKETVWNIYEDSDSPVFSDFSTTRGTNTVIFRFKIVDTRISRTNVTGVDYDTLSSTGLSFLEDGDFRSTEIVLGAAEPQRSIIIKVKDKIGNPGIITTPVLNPISIASQRTGFRTATFPGEEVELTVTSSKPFVTGSKPFDLAQFTASIAGKTVRLSEIVVSSSSSATPNDTLTATVTIPDPYPHTEASIPFEISGFKDSEGIPGISMVLSSTTDGTSVNCWPTLSGETIKLKKGTGNSGSDPEVGDEVVLSFSVAAAPALNSDPEVSFTSNGVDLPVTKDTSVSDPSYKYTHTVVAEDLSGSTSAEVEYTIKFPDSGGNLGDVADGTSSFELSPTTR